MCLEHILGKRLEWNINLKKSWIGSFNVFQGFEIFAAEIPRRLLMRSRAVARMLRKDREDQDNVTFP